MSAAASDQRLEGWTLTAVENPPVDTFVATVSAPVLTSNRYTHRFAGIVQGHIQTLARGVKRHRERAIRRLWEIPGGDCPEECRCPGGLVEPIH